MIRVLYPMTAPVLSKFVNQQNQDQNSNFNTLCSVSKGTEPLTFDWYKNGKLIVPGGDKRYKIEKSKLFSTFGIERVIRSDSGNYTCLVKNSVGSDSHNVLLVVKGKISLLE